MKQERIIVKNQKEVNFENLYTFIMDFRGGTYISQIKAKGLTEACEKWLEKLSTKDVKYLGSKTKMELYNELKNEMVTPINGVDNIWIMNFLPFGYYITVHIIKTDSVIE